MRAYDFNEYFSEVSKNNLSSANKAIHLQWKKFIHGDMDIDTGIVSPETLSEWMRCREMNIDPFGIPQNIILTSEALQEKFHEQQVFINICQPFLHKLFRFLKDFSHAVTLLDRDGYMLKVITDAKYVMNNRMFNCYPGSRWTYEHSGNCCPACILEKKKPVQIIGANHYLNCFHFIAASGAPIADPDGELLGCIMVTTFYSATHPHSLAMAMAAAQAIENEWRAQRALVQCKAAFEVTDIVSSMQNIIMSSIPEALIAVNNDGGIMNINQKARNLFALGDKNVIGMPLRSVFRFKENEGFLSIVEQRESVSYMEISIRTDHGTGDYSLTCNNITLSGGNVIGKLLILSEIKRIKSLVARTIGARANFTFQDIHTQNEGLKTILDQAVTMSKSTSNVLLLGESGTGKDILAQAIHNASLRKNGPYVAINCAAIPRDLIASELFGHAEGAFTGSRRGGSQGKFELADGGTIFLDEIAETSLDIQAVLLRVIEDKCVVRVGSNQVRTVDVRIISATNRDLPAEVARGNFRKDLYYRLNVFNIHLPPLRERQDDIPLLTNYFIQKYARAQNKNILNADEKVLAFFMSYPWPGNVRELQNVVERMVNYASSDELTIHLIPAEIIDTRPIRRQSLDFELPSEKEKRLLRHMLALKLSKKNIAEQLHMSRTTLYYKLKKYGLPNDGNG